MPIAKKFHDLIHPLFEQIVVDHVENGIKDTLSQMGQFDCQFKPVFHSATWTPPTKISVMVDIKQGDIPFQVRIHFDPAPVAEILETMLGEKVDPESPDILDGIGEISNMIYGQFKTKANSNGFALSMGRPAPFFTHTIPQNINPGSSLIIPFTINQGECYFQFIVF